MAVEVLVFNPETEYGATADNLVRVHPSAVINDRSASGAPFGIERPAGLQYRLDSASLYIRKFGSPVGVIRAYLYLAEYCGGGAYRRPSGASLAASEPQAIEDLPTTMTLIRFYFTLTNRYIMNSRTWYVIVLQIDSATLINAANRVEVAQDTTDVTHYYNNTCYHNSDWQWNSARDGIFYIYGEFYCDTDKSWFNPTKTCFKNEIRSAIPEAMVSGNWREEGRYIARNLPFISVRFSPERLWDLYDRDVGEASAGSVADYFFSVHVFHSNCTSGEPTCEKGLYAQHVASRIVSYLKAQPVGVGFDIMDVTARESEPARGGKRISRVIIEGAIQIRRID